MYVVLNLSEKKPSSLNIEGSNKVSINIQILILIRYIPKIFLITSLYHMPIVRRKLLGVLHVAASDAMVAVIVSER